MFSHHRPRMSTSKEGTPGGLHKKSNERSESLEWKSTCCTRRVQQPGCPDFLAIHLASGDPPTQPAQLAGSGLQQRCRDLTMPQLRQSKRRRFLS
eukprot:scaffold17436_cov44-Prasinocladus_malaysianus.AAC.1